jgi:hypothetical protein
MLTHRKLLQDNVHDKKRTRTEQIVQQFKDACDADGVEPWCCAFDKSGAGGPFGDVVAMSWSPEVLGVQFGGKASELPVSISDNTLSSDRYVNRVSELWFGAKELIRTGQFKGVDRELAKEMCARKYSTKKGTSLRMEVESKTDMKARTGASPDLADAAMILIELCRQRFGFGGMTVTMKKHESSVQVKRRIAFSRLSSANSGRTIKFKKFSI